MKTPPFPEDEPERLEALRGLDILDTPLEARFDRVTRLAQQLFQVPIALVSLVDADRQWFKSQQGLGATETPRDISFCGHAILGDAIFVVPNALEDGRFADNPLVCGVPDIRFYAGAPLHSSSGHRVGTLCIIDRRPRSFSGEELRGLRDLADCVEAELEHTHLLERAARERSLAMVAEHTTLGVSIADAQGLLEWVNPGFERITGYSRREVLGRAPGSLLQGPGTDGKTALFMDSCIQEGVPFQVEVLHYRKDGQPYWSDLTVQPVRNDEGKLTNFITIKNDITGRKRMEARINEAEQQLRAVVENVVDGIITIDEQGTILSANAAAVKIFGYSKNELIGQSIKMLMPEPFNSAPDTYLHAYLRDGLPKIIGQSREAQGRRKDGEAFPMELAVSELVLNDRRIFTGLTRDVTERKRLEQLKSEFISTVSHELRTPLTAIRGALTLVLKKDGEALSAKARPMIEMAERNSERLALLINDILDLEKIEGGSLSFDFGALDLAALAVRAAEDTEGYARKHGVSLKLETHGLTAQVKGDPHRLQQVFANLISNAVKFSPPAGVVEVSVVAVQGRFRVSVKDHGPGIPDHFRDRIFQRFAQADSSDSRDKGGTGLGLSITKAIIDRHRGRIGFTSRPGEGAEFFFDLPAHFEIEESEEGAGPRVLICEDDPDWARVLQRMVKAEGLVADLAATAKAARTLLAKHSYQLLLLDLALPGETRLSLLEDLRKQPNTEHLPVLVVSGTALEGQAAIPGNPLAVTDWLQKPLDQARLSRALRSIFIQGVRPRILHVEDDPDLVQLVRSLLGGEVDYMAVATCREAKDQLKAQPWDLLLLDIGLPDGSGLDLLSRVPGQCQVIIFSAQPPDRQLSSKIVASLTKSVTTNEAFLAAVRRAIQQGAATP